MVGRGTTDLPSWLPAGVLAFAVLVVAFLAFELAPWPPDEPAGSAVTLQQRVEPRSIAVLGDSFTERDGARTGREWPALLRERTGWRVAVDAVPGSGYTTVGAGRPVSDRVARFAARQDPDLYVLAVGMHDVERGVGPTAIAAAATRAARALHRADAVPLLMLSPFSAGTPGESSAAASNALRTACGRLHWCTFVDAIGWLPADVIRADGVHLTAAGHQLLSVRIGAAIETALP